MFITFTYNVVYPRRKSAFPLGERKKRSHPMPSKCPQMLAIRKCLLSVVQSTPDESAVACRSDPSDWERSRILGDISGAESIYFVCISLLQMLQSALAACNCVMRRKKLLSFAISSAGLPSSATWPSANTTILSAASTVRIR